MVFHHTGGSYEGAVSWLCDRRAQASAHVVIAKDGRRTVLADDDQITWHAGKSSFRGRSHCNAYMVGVEFEGNTNEEPLTDAQIASAIEWLEERWDTRGWTMDWMIDHRTVARPKGRKSDLDPDEWDRLRFHIAKHFDPAYELERVDYRPLDLED